MMRRLVVLALALAAGRLPAAVTVLAPPPTVTDVPTGKRSVQNVTLANEVASFTLTYDIVRPPGFAGRPEDEITSHWWAWTTGYTTLGLTAPSNSHWYFQGFLNWRFDDESLHKRPATFRVVRDGGADGVVEFAWDTPKVRAWLRFALPSGGDKLLMFGAYEPKQPVTESRLDLMTYTSGFPEPRNRAVTTATRTVRPGETITLDPAAERWVLYEDTTEGRHADGSAGLVIGTPDAFGSVRIPVGDYGINTQLRLKPEARSFALGLYSYPSLPEYEATRAYFRAGADLEAQRLGEAAARGLDAPLAAWPMHEQRAAYLRERAQQMTRRPAELWRPDPAPLDFPWAARLAGGPIKTVLFTPRWCAWETMELARRLEMDVSHLYFDSATAIANPDMWPYRSQTGIGSLGAGTASVLAVDLAQRPDTELYLCAGISGAAMPPPAREAMLERVRGGAGVMLVGSPAYVDAWPKELFATPDAELAQGVLDGFAWETIPGYRPGDRGRVGEAPPVAAYRFGQGRVVAMRVGLNSYSALVPRNNQVEGQQGALDRGLALAARAALAAAGRQRSGLSVRGGEGGGLTVEVEAGHSLEVRLQDDLDRIIAQPSPQDREPARVTLPPAPAGRLVWLDAVVRDGQGRAVDFTTLTRPASGGPAVKAVELPGAVQPEGTLTPRVPLPGSGRMAATVRLADTPPRGAVVRWTVTDAFDRLLAQEETPATGATVQASLVLTPPVTPNHRLNVSLRSGGRELAFERLRFTRPVPHAYDDFVPLMWSYAGGDPVLRRTDRACFDWGAGMMDLCNIIGLPADRAAREFALSSESGLRLIPYVTRIYGQATPDRTRTPCLHDPAHVERTRASVRTLAQQAAPYSPPAFTLGDENILIYGDGEACHKPETLTAFGQWLQGEYGTAERLSRSWGSEQKGFESLAAPPLLQEAAKLTASFAPWIDHKRFMDTEFAAAHNDLARVIREELPGAKVGWDGFLGYNWRSGYDFEKLTEQCDLTQCYTVNWLQGEFIRSFRKPGGLTGKWGNATADNEAGFSAWPWACLFDGDNSVWWWTSWGCDYIPFNPDLSQSQFGEWFFKAAREVAAGPGKLLLHAQRVDSPIVVRYPHPDLFAATLVSEMVPQGAPVPGAGDFWRHHEGLLKGLKDAGYQYRHVSYRTLGDDLARSGAKVACLSEAMMLSDADVAALRQFVEAGGTLLVDGRAGFLDEHGRVRETRALDELLGVRSRAGAEGLKQETAKAEATFDGELGGQRLSGDKVPVTVLEPSLELAGATAFGRAGETPVVIVRELGRGRTVLLNLAMADIVAQRTKSEPQPLVDLLAAVVRSAGVEPPVALAAPDGGRPRCSEVALWQDGEARYLALQQDLRLTHLADQPVRVRLPQAAVVYDVRAGQRVGTGAVAEWETVLSRGTPRLYALLPYEVTGPVAVQAPTSPSRGQTVRVPVRVTPAGRAAAGFHVVRLDVFAPGSERPHRLYSQNVACASGTGEASFPMALSDPSGAWRLAARDVASGTTGTATLQVR